MMMGSGTVAAGPAAGAEAGTGTEAEPSVAPDALGAFGFFVVLGVEDGGAEAFEVLADALRLGPVADPDAGWSADADEGVDVPSEAAAATEAVLGDF